VATEGTGLLLGPAQAVFLGEEGSYATPSSRWAIHKSWSQVDEPAVAGADPTVCVWWSASGWMVRRRKKLSAGEPIRRSSGDERPRSHLVA
jgi:hypothetical protein